MRWCFWSWYIWVGLKPPAVLTQRPCFVWGVPTCAHRWLRSLIKRTQRDNKDWMRFPSVEIVDWKQLPVAFLLPLSLQLRALQLTWKPAKHLHFSKFKLRREDQMHLLLPDCLWHCVTSKVSLGFQNQMKEEELRWIKYKFASAPVGLHDQGLPRGLADLSCWPLVQKITEIYCETRVKLTGMFLEPFWTILVDLELYIYILSILYYIYKASWTIHT